MLNDREEVTPAKALDYILLLMDRVRKALDLPQPERMMVLAIMNDWMKEAVAMLEAAVEQENSDRDDSAKS
ncbi:MAG TPA: hypothetical protein VHV10_04995 [Ktedonobacteraceae bacterium]|jgi:hypothetical protein|nr:hypothetical protein [Ktedonobacteraceae bacterium]